MPEYRIKDETLPPEPEEIDAPEQAKSEQIEFSDWDIFQWLASLPADYIKCRLRNHDWDDPPGYYDTRIKGDNARKVKEMKLTCSRCNAEKFERIHIKGGRIHRETNTPIYYDDDYLAPPGMKVTKAKVFEYRARTKGLGGGLASKTISGAPRK